MEQIVMEGTPEREIWRHSFKFGAQNLISLVIAGAVEMAGIW